MHSYTQFVWVRWPKITVVFTHHPTGCISSLTLKNSVRKIKLTVSYIAYAKLLQPCWIHDFSESTIWGQFSRHWLNSCSSCNMSLNWWFKVMGIPQKGMIACCLLCSRYHPSVKNVNVKFTVVLCWYSRSCTVFQCHVYEMSVKVFIKLFWHLLTKYLIIVPDLILY